MLRLSSIVALLLLAASAGAQSSSLLLTVTDENGIAVPGAVIQLQGPATLRCETDHAGRCSFRAPAGSYRLAINKDGFYALSTNLRLPEVSHLDLTLAHTQEVKESVEVVASTPQIDSAHLSPGRVHLSTCRWVLTGFPGIRVHPSQSEISGDLRTGQSGPISGDLRTLPME